VIRSNNVEVRFGSFLPVDRPQSGAVSGSPGGSETRRTLCGHITIWLISHIFVTRSRWLRALNGTPTEPRFYCFGRVTDGILTVRFTYRGNLIRIIGAGYWRRGKKLYEAHSKVRK
jgi:hypothetical protein